MVLFLGGQENGRRLDVLPLDHHVFFPARQRAIMSVPWDDGPPRLSLDTVIYRRKRLLIAPGAETEVFFPDGWADQWNMKALADYLTFGSPHD